MFTETQVRGFIREGLLRAARSGVDTADIEHKLLARLPHVTDLLNDRMPRLVAEILAEVHHV